MKDPDNSSTRGIFETLQEMPLLRGASSARLNELAGRFKLRFRKAEAGEEIIRRGEQCNSLMFLLSGSVRMTTDIEPESTLKVSQTLNAPQVIAPEYLFGLNTSYPAGVTAIDNVGLMYISKDDYRKILGLDPVFFFNYLNTVCAASQRAAGGLMTVACGTAADRLNYWLTTLTQPGATDIELHSTTRELHSLLGVSAAALRTAVSRLGATLADPHTLRVQKG